jgi:integrase
MAIWKTKWGWRAEFVQEGKRIMAKGTFKYKDEARQWVKEEKEKLKTSPSKSSFNEEKQEQDISFWFLAQKYLKTCKTNYDRKTVHEKTYCYKRFYKAVGNLDVTEIQPPMILDFLDDRAESQSNNAANKDRKNLKAFFRWIQKVHGIMHDPTGPIEKKPHSKKSRRIIPIQDILKVMLAAKGHERVLIGSYWHTGARKGEVLRWTWADDINFEERWVRLGTKKSRDGSMVYEKIWINDDLYELLLWQWKHRHPTSPYVFCHMNPKSKFYGKVFTERRKTLKSLCETAKVEPFGYHDIRHTVAKYLNDLQKVGLKKVQQVLRHRRQTTTEVYVEGNYTDTKDVVTLLELKKMKKFTQNSRKKSRKKAKTT